MNKSDLNMAIGAYLCSCVVLICNCSIVLAEEEVTSRDRLMPTVLAKRGKLTYVDIGTFLASS